MSDDKRRRELRERLKKSGGKIMFFARGATCPACGYVFSNGFSRITDGEATPDEPSATICTRCLRPLVLEPTGVLRFPTDAERAEIEAAEESHEQRLMRDMIGFYREGKS